MSLSPLNPVLLVHGFWDTATLFDRMSAYLQSLGRSTYGLDLVPNNGDLGLDVLAQQVCDYIDRTFAPEQPIDLVGYSMGGIVSRYYIQRLGGIDRVRRFVTVASPHHGTWTAYTFDRPGCIHMRPNSEFLQDLNRDAIDLLGRIQFTSLWTPFDLMILPAQSSIMPVGQNIELPVLVHRWMVSDSRSLQAIGQVLCEPL
jgi:triacylglycerol lipase